MKSVSTALLKVCAASAAAFVMTTTFSATASAQDLFSFLWGGDEKHGGDRKTVSFPGQYNAGQVIVSFGDRRLYWVYKKGEAVSYPIAVPREQSRWQGVTNVSMKRENPSWTPTAEMRTENPKLPTYVPGGHPLNPLGVRALYLGSSTYRIHGTDAPWTIGQAVSKGCIRMYNQDVLDLYPRVRVGSKVTVTWNKYGAGTPVAAADPAPKLSPTVERTKKYYRPIAARRVVKTAQAVAGE